MGHLRFSFPRRSGLLALACASALAGCGSSGFQGGSSRKPSASTPLPANDQALPGDSGASPGPGKSVDGPSDTARLGSGADDASLKACFRHWGITATAPLLHNVKVLEGSTFGPLSTNELVDDDVTTSTRVVLVKAFSFGPVSQVSVKLLNPKGLYCLQSATFAVIAKMDVEKHCSAMIASDGTAAFGVKFTKSVRTVGSCGKA